MNRTCVAALVTCALLAPAGNAEEAPDFAGQLLDVVKDEIEAAHFDLVVDKVDSSTTIGTILMQAPEAGHGVGPKRILWLRVSDGVVMPDLLGMTVGDAAALLREQGVSSLIQVHSDADPIDLKVVDQFPEPGLRFDASAEVATLMFGWYFSEPLPDMVGVRLADAIGRIEAMGLSVRPVPDGPYPSDGPCMLSTVAAVVTSTEPPAGTAFASTRAVTIHYRHEVIKRERLPCSPDGKREL